MCVQMLAGDEDRWRERGTRMRRVRACVRVCVRETERKGEREKEDGEPGTMATSFNYKVR